MLPFAVRPEHGLGLVPISDEDSFLVNAITLRFRALVEAAGLPPIRLRDLRHGTATRMLATGTQMKVVQKHLGHSRYATSADYYTAVMPSLARAAAESSAALVPRHTGRDRAA